MATAHPPREHHRTRIGASEIASAIGFYTRDKAREPGTFAYQAGLDYTKSWTDSVVAFGWITTCERRSPSWRGSSFIAMPQPRSTWHGDPHRRSNKEAYDPDRTLAAQRCWRRMMTWY